MDELRATIKRHGTDRAKARAKVAAESEAIAALAPEAIDGGMAKTEFCKLAQITRPALDAMLKDSRRR